MECNRVNEIFHSLQGDGVHAGTPNLFLRFSRCNLECRVREDSPPYGGST